MLWDGTILVGELSWGELSWASFKLSELRVRILVVDDASTTKSLSFLVGIWLGLAISREPGLHAKDDFAFS